MDARVASFATVSSMGRLQSLQSQVKPHLLLDIACLFSLGERQYFCEGNIWGIKTTTGQPGAKLARQVGLSHLVLFLYHLHRSHLHSAGQEVATLMLKNIFHFQDK